jgi:cyclopropane-fatty-acyl-phospholipid synthase
LRLIAANGKSYDIGDGTVPHLAIKLHRKNLEWLLGFNPQLKIGEAYMDGLLTIEQGNLRDFLQFLLFNYNASRDSPMMRRIEWLHGATLRIKQFNPIGRARRNASFHYDLPDRLYDFFLDPDRQYSCAYFRNPGDSLEQAQRNKKRHIASKLLLDRPDLRVLDIGSGWGGLGLYLAREAGCRVTGVTLSTEQLKFSRARAWREGLSKICRFELRDYRQEKGPYDRIVSVGMFEHVGKKNYDEFFAKIRDLLTEDGVCLLHAVGRFNEPGLVNAFIRKHVFPGADVPVLSEVLEPIERSGLLVTDIEILRLHYAKTLKRWSERLRTHRAEIVELYGERFYRKWEFYLISCEMGFRCDALMVFQIQLGKRREALPITRDYMTDWERSHDWPISKSA